MKSQPIAKDATAEVQSAIHGQCYNPSLIHIAFLCLIEKVSELLQLCGIKKLIERCESIMASEQNNIKLFSNDQIEKMNECFYATTLLQVLSNFFTWSNHSILRVLLAIFSNEGVELLKEFDSMFDSLQSIASYPIPHFSSEMIPDDTSIYTILAIRCDQELYKSTLQYVFDIQSVMMEKCDITEHCLQLLAFRNDPTVFYWTIPKCIVNLINSQVPKHSEYLYSKGVLEVMVYPEPLLTIDDDLRIGSLAFVTEIKDNDIEVLYIYIYIYILILRNFQL